MREAWAKKVGLNTNEKCKCVIKGSVNQETGRGHKFNPYHKHPVAEVGTTLSGCLLMTCAITVKVTRPFFRPFFPFLAFKTWIREKITHEIPTVRASVYSAIWEPKKRIAGTQGRSTQNSVLEGRKYENAHSTVGGRNFKIKIWAEGEKTSDGERGLCIKFRFFRVILPLGVACSIVGLDR